MYAQSRSCRIEVLSTSEHCTVGFCRRCNVFHVDLGAVSLRLNTLQLHALGGGIAHALDVYKRQILMGHRTVGEAADPVH